MAVRSFVGAFGHVVLDHIVSVPRLPKPDTSIEILDRSRYFGGTAGNLARATARLGTRVSLASFVGADFPKDYRSALAKDGVDLRDLREVPGYPTPTAWVFSDPRGQQMTVIDQGPWRIAPRMPVLRHSVRDVDLVHVGTGRPEYYAKVMRAAQEADRPIAFDPAQELRYVYDRRRFRALFRMATYFFGNEAEVAQAMRFVGATSVVDLLRTAEAVVVTRGAKGSAVITRDGRFRIPAVRPRRIVDVTGAGDAYRAGFYAGLARGYDLRHCGILGSAVASFTLEEKGTQTNLPTWKQAVARARHHATF
ncbi:MAG TPA: carbohydrate kinase family protein [Thermoplasmata archaeon]|nr:carbohydrate kinase family protein [Thermoplasmata archaeon]